MPFTQADYEAAAQIIRSRTTMRPTIGLVLGSGLGQLADTLEDRIAIPYADIPNWPRSTVEGHHGQLVIGKMEGHTVVTQQGRAHLYEGYSPQQVTFPIRVMHFLGIKILILTNAAGGINTDYQVGDVMLLNDHISLPGMAGMNPLIGPNDPAIGDRFVGMAQTYDRELRALARRVASEARLPLQEGVYLCLSGPTFESPAEIRMMRAWGADAVGMSTVHEVMVARHAGIRVLALSGVTNKAIDAIDSAGETTHDEVMESGEILVPRMTTILKGVLRALPS